MENTCEQVGKIQLPAFSGLRVMMLPVRLGDLGSLPDDLAHWRHALAELFTLAPVKVGIAYLTVDERVVQAGEASRRPGLHVDGVYRGLGGAWGGGGGWGRKGFLTVASHEGCRVWPGVQVDTDAEGECEHVRRDLGAGEMLRAGAVYRMGGMCVHESVPQAVAVARQFVRLSMPNDSPWFEGYTRNSKGIEPEGPVLPRRAFMDM